MRPGAVDGRGRAAMRPTPIEEIIEQMDAGLDRAVLRVLSQRVGQDMAIDKALLIFELGRMGFGVRQNKATFERQVRRCIVELRKSGQLICSSSGEGGYFLAGTQQEYDTFVQEEYVNKIEDMKETVAAMNAEAIKRWGHGMQMGLF